MDIDEYDSILWENKLPTMAAYSKIIKYQSL